MRRYLVSILAAAMAAGGLSLSACSSAHDVDVAALVDGGVALSASEEDAGGGGAAEPDAGDTPPSTTGEAGAAGGEAGQGGEAGGEAGGGGPPPPPGSCEPCEPSMGFLGSFPECCTGEGRCGLDLGSPGAPDCVEQNAPGVMTPQCPDQAAMGFNIPGCCTRQGTCGVVIMMLAPLGCVDLETAGGVLMGFGGGGPSTPCSDTPD